MDVLATGLPYLTEACLAPFAAVQYADGPFARSGAETEQASRDKWRELLLLLARPIGEFHVAVETVRSEPDARNPLCLFQSRPDSWFRRKFVSP